MIYQIYNELYEYKDTEGNINLLLLLILRYLILLSTGGTISPTSLPPRCWIVSVSSGDFNLFLLLWHEHIIPCQRLYYSTHYLIVSSWHCTADRFIYMCIYIPGYIELYGDVSRRIMLPPRGGDSNHAGWVTGLTLQVALLQGPGPCARQQLHITITSISSSHHTDHRLGGDKMLSILILKLNKLHVLLYFSTYKLRVNLMWYVNNIFCFLD